MSRYFLRIAVAVLSFSIGLFGVWASGDWNRFEDFIVKRFDDKGKENTIPPLSDIETKETKLVYKTVLDTLIFNDAFFNDVKRLVRLKDIKHLVVLDYFPNKPKIYKAEDAEKNNIGSFRCEQGAFLVITESEYGNSEICHYFSRNLPNSSKIDNDTLTNYRSKINEIQKPSDLPNLDVPITLVGKETLDNIFNKSNSQSWDAFYEVYPNSSGVIYLSEVGFNFDFTQAILFVSQSCNSQCGGSDFYLLNKHNDVWVIEEVITK